MSQKLFDRLERPPRWLPIALLLVFLVVISLPEPADAHPGGTDGSGCHTCRTNCTESWGIPYGYYHRHNPVRDCSDPPPTTQPPPTTTTTRPTTTTSQQTTTTRAPPVIEGDTLAAQLGSVRQSVLALSGELLETNERWESGEATFSETRLSLAGIALGVSQWLHTIETQALIDDDGTAGVELAQALDTLEAAAVDVIEGLEAPDTGGARTEAVGLWLAAVSGFDSLVTGLTASTTTSSTIASSSSATMAVQTTTTSAEIDATSTTVPIAADEESPNDGNSGWIVIVMAVGGVAYWLGRRRGPNT